MAFVTRRQELLGGNLAGAALKGLDAVNGAVDLLSPPIGFRHEAGDGVTVAGDDDARPALDLVEKLGQMRLSVRGLDFAHSSISIGRFDWLKYALASGERNLHRKVAHN
ncbi:MAG TPA: hypothetical protein VGI79_14250 [Caulobacteraceae bacterium]